jgi:hypothetical protein
VLKVKIGHMKVTRAAPVPMDTISTNKKPEWPEWGQQTIYTYFGRLPKSSNLINLT